MDEHSKQNTLTNRKPILLVGIILLLIMIVLFFAQKNGFLRLGSSKNAMTPTPAQSGETTGKMYLTSFQESHSYGVNEEFALDLRVDTSSQRVGGYDAVIIYDKSTLEFVGAQNLIQDFEMFTNEIDLPENAGTHLSITGIMKLEKQKTFAFQQEPVARLTFKGRKAGATTLKFHFTPGETNDSNIVLNNATTDEILGSVEDFNLTIGSLQSLKVGGTYTDPTSGISVKLDKITESDSLCNDCTTDAQLTVSYKDQKETISLFNGGLEGKVVDSSVVFGHIIETKNITGKSLEISVIPE